MKRKFVVLALMAVATAALLTAEVSAWGWWRYRAACRGPLFPRLHCRACGGASCFTCDRPYNAFSPREKHCGLGGGFRGCGLRNRGWHSRASDCGMGCPSGEAGGCTSCMANPNTSGEEIVQHIDPSLIPFMGQAPQQMTYVQYPQQMPVQQMNYPVPYANYGVQPVNYMPAYYPQYPTYPNYYYPMQPTYPNYGYGYNYGY